MNKIFLSLGSNIGDKKENLKKAINLLQENISNVKLSKFYKTKPYGETNQDNFLNMVISGETNLFPEELLEFVKNIENEIGRTQTYRWGPRIIDIDILFYDYLILETPDLIIPHIGIEKRDFVLKPLLDLELNFVHPKLGKSVKELYEKLDKTTLTII
ncbi:MAG: 2-amino-4-hydroxy-6-hydroxymethyldihydropteridine diphosphokinase [Candidatus Gracilibacteria bacterium]|nr:2-amino-4-hydroxy-6-hydroxymethyldihydropteridine diphosphokinase [Candidatus Gracilibacteria bacterium]